MIITRIEKNDKREIKHLSEMPDSSFHVFKGNWADGLYDYLCTRLYVPIHLKTNEEINESGSFQIELKDTLKESSGENYSISKEYLSLRIFDSSYEYDKVLNHYLFFNDFYEENQFSDLTNQMGTTDIFRSFIREYISAFEPVPLDIEKKIWITLDKNGIFHLETEENETRIDKKERNLFQFICYLKLNEFWEGASELRGPETPKYPLLIKNAPSELNDRIKEECSKTSFQALVFQN